MENGSLWSKRLTVHYQFLMPNTVEFTIFSAQQRGGEGDQKITFVHIAQRDTIMLTNLKDMNDYTPERNPSNVTTV
jgi:hypothetical protein